MVLDTSGSMKEGTGGSYTYQKFTGEPRHYGDYYGKVNGEYVKIYYGYYDSDWKYHNDWYYYDDSYNRVSYTDTDNIYTREYNNSSRLDIAKESTRSLVEQLLSNNTTENPDAVTVKLVTFNTDANNAIELKKNNYISTINGLEADGGTNWEAALTKANSAFSNNNSSKYVIFVSDGDPTFSDTTLGMPSLIEILMLTAAALILILTKTDGIKATQGSIFPAGMQAVIAIFGIAWMGDTFINGNITELTASIEGIVTEMPWLFGAALFVMSILLYSQAATVRAIVPLGIALGMSPMMLIALFPAVNGYFFIPNYPTVVAAINFDRTGTTGIGKYILNHSFMMPGLVATVVSLAVGLLMIQLF